MTDTNFSLINTDLTPFLPRKGVFLTFFSLINDGYDAFFLRWFLCFYGCMIITEKMLIRIEERRLVMKRQGKISPNIRNETKKNNYPDLPRASGNQERMMSKVEMDEHIKQRVDEIHEKYSLDCCLLIVGDLTNIPIPLWIMYFNGEQNDKLTVFNLDNNYLMYKNGKLDAYDFLCALDALFTTLVREFAEITEMFLSGSIEGKENCNERS
jgi:hypothetical protein